VNSQQLADQVKRCVLIANYEGQVSDQVAEQIIADAQSRILGVGAEQYAEGDQQKFETMALAELVEYAREETLDLINYGVMLTLRIERLAEMVRAAEARLSDTEE